jgi:ParB-like chromosome segregation protein Spo0J
MAAPKIRKKKAFLHGWHPHADDYPKFADGEYDRLVQSIKERGQMLPITYYIEEGKRIGLDGRHREKASLEAGKRPVYKRVSKPTDPEGVIDAVNLERRHLTGEQAAEKRAQAAVRMRAEGQTHQEIADKLGVDRSTVSKDLKSVGENSPTDGEIIGKDKKKYPAKRTRTSKSKDEPKEEDANKSIDAICKALENVFSTWKEKPVQQNNPWLRDAWDGLKIELRGIVARLKACKTTNGCPRCRSEGCHNCRDTGRVPHQVYQRLT